MTTKSDELVEELVSACIAFGREKEPDWQTRIEKAQREIKAYISELEAAQRWISVSERLPEATEYVYAVVYDAIDNTSKVSMLKHYGDGNWFSWESERYVVTHWMPLPESPNDTQTDTFVYGKGGKR